MALRGVWVALGLLGSGCLESQPLVPCGDERCRDGATCVADRCVSQGQLEACSGLADGESCTFEGIVGRCSGGVCGATSCGNGDVELGEACDDSNEVSGDGCRSDCQKVEACGDGFIDEGEACDDANTNPADHCDECSATQWTATPMLQGVTSPTQKAIEQPRSLAIDNAGTVYIGTLAGTYYRVDSNLIMTSLAPLSGSGRDLEIDGAGTLYGGGSAISLALARYENGAWVPAVAASSLQQPDGIAIDGLGNLVLTYAPSCEIVRFDPFANVETALNTPAACGYAGDGGLATSAQFDNPTDVAFDAEDNLYVVDEQNDRVRKIDAQTNMITTVAGNGSVSSSGDDGPATSAGLASPTAVAFDAQGRMLVAHSTRLRRIENGIITTISGGVGSVPLGDGGPAIAARFSSLNDMEIAPNGDIFLADTSNNRVRRIDSAGIITTFAGTGAAKSADDRALATSVPFEGIEAAQAFGDDIYFIASNDFRVRRLDANGVMTVVAGTGVSAYAGDGGPALDAQLQAPTSVAVDGEGNVYVGDSSRIRKIDVTTGTITRYAGGGVTTAAEGVAALDANLVSVVAIAAAADTVYVSAHFGSVIWRVGANGLLARITGTPGSVGAAGDNGPALAATITANSLALRDGVIVLATLDGHRIRAIENGTIATIVGTGTPGFSGDNGPAVAAQIYRPDGVGFDAAGNLYIGDAVNRRVRRVSAGTITTIAGNGSATDRDGDGGPAGAAVFNSAIALLTVTPSGDVLLATNGSPSQPSTLARIRNGTIEAIAGAVDPDGMGSTTIAKLGSPAGLALGQGIAFVAGGASGTLQIVRDGIVRTVAGRYPQPSAIGDRARFRGATFGAVGGVTFDATTRRIFLSEAGGKHRIHVVDATSDDHAAWTITAAAGAAVGYLDGPLATARFRQPSGLAFDATTRKLYIADTGNHVIRMLDTTDLATATVSTIAGRPGELGNTGDGSMATLGYLNAPTAITTCGNGDLFIADTGNHRVRRVAADGTLSTVLGQDVAASSGEGSPAFTFAVDTPRGIACDARGNVYVTSSSTVRMLPADAAGIVDGSGQVITIYGRAQDPFPATVTSCLSGVAVVDDRTLAVTDSCTGFLVELRRDVVQP